MRKNSLSFGSTQVLVAVALIATVLSVPGCFTERGRPLFKLLDSRETGIDFANTITASDSFNVQTDVYIYNGAGVAAGDIDNDGLSDLFFSGNMVSSRLYLNKGKMRFEDITRSAGVTTARWATGATMADVNNDGYLDIYVSVSGPEKSKPEDRANLLFINNRNRTFTEAAARYGVADTGFTTHAAFLDYDRDGCLDLFLLNNSPKDFTRGVTSHPMAGRDTTPGSYNQLYRNDCVAGNPGHFTNVSAKAGILRDVGYGLGVTVSDLNGDGWPDIYISNDGMPNDVVYINNHDGTFTNNAAKMLKHASQAGMGVDIADFDNDGRPDILQVDMLPSDLQRRKRTGGNTTFGTLADARRRGFRDDYSQNSLQLNNGVNSDGDAVFSEISRLAGVSRTDWSWSALFADFDNDGYKDIFIGNGYPKAVNDLDYMGIAYSALRSGDIRRARQMLRDLPPYKFPNYVFRNNGDLTFTDMTKEWGMSRPSYSYGAAYVDLNNDGALDLVINDMDGPALVYQNVGSIDDAHHYLEVRLVGESPRERSAVTGARIMATAGALRQFIYQSPYRGYMSTMDDRAHFGLGRATRVDTLEVQWPDGRRQLLTNVAANQLLTVNQSAATKPPSDTAAATPATSGPWFEAVRPTGLDYSPPPATPLDFTIQPLLPYAISHHGPAIASADVNGDGLDDLYIGGTPGLPGRLFLQRKDGSFAASGTPTPWEADKQFDDWGALFFDANGDGRPDLYVVSGGYTLVPGSPLLQDRLYINQGSGRFVRDAGALPPMTASKATVRAGDFNGDGKPDLFVGGRLVPRKYPYPTRSYILRNDGGRFTDVTETVAPELAREVGMITDAVWVDFDGDGRLDLVTVGEWMPIRFYRNDGTRLRDVTGSTGLPSLRGWWYSIAAGDFDHDGRADLVAGNLGLNYSYTTSPDTTFEVFASSFSGNQTTDVVLAEKVNGIDYSIAGMSPLGRAIYTTSVRFPTFGAFANARLDQLIAPAQLQQALHYEIDTFASVFLHNEGAGKFSSSPLPNPAQIAPARAVIGHDVDGDGKLDLILGGNLLEVDPNNAPADAGNGLWLKGDGAARFTAVSAQASGFFTPRQVSGLEPVKTAKGTSIVVANAGDSLQVFAIRKR